MPIQKVARLTDVLRWLVIACAGLLWFVLLRLAGDDRVVGVALALLVPAGLIAISRLVIGAVPEDTAASVPELVESSRDPDREPIRSTREGLAILRLHDEVQMMALDGNSCNLRVFGSLTE